MVLVVGRGNPALIALRIELHLVAGGQYAAGWQPEPLAWRARPARSSVNGTTLDLAFSGHLTHIQACLARTADTRQLNKRESDLPRATVRRADTVRSARLVAFAHSEGCARGIAPCAADHRGRARTALAG